MLRITTEQDDKTLTLRLEGQVEGPWVEVLRKTWSDLVSRDGQHKVVVDFEGVTFADAEGRKLLFTMQKQGVAMIKLSGFMREVLGRQINQNDLQEKGE